MNKSLKSMRVGFGIGLMWMVLFALAGHLIPNATASLHSAAAVGSNPLTTKALVPPGHLNAAWERNDVILTWTAGAGGDGYVILGSASGAPTCGAANWKQIGRVAGIAMTTFRDEGRVITKGQWYCYQVETSMTNWTSSANPTTAIQQRHQVQEAAGATPTPNRAGFASALQVATAYARPAMSKPPALRGKPTSVRATASPSKARSAIVEITGTATRTSTLAALPAGLPTATPATLFAAAPTLADVVAPGPVATQATPSLVASVTPVNPTIVIETSSQ